MTVFTKLTDRFSEAEVDGEIVLMRLDQGQFYSLTEVSAFIWRLLDQPQDRNDLVAAVQKTFDGPDYEIASQVDAFLARLKEAGLLDVE